MNAWQILVVLCAVCPFACLTAAALAARRRTREHATPHPAHEPVRPASARQGHGPTHRHCSAHAEGATQAPPMTISLMEHR